MVAGVVDGVSLSISSRVVLVDSAVEREDGGDGGLRLTFSTAGGSVAVSLSSETN